MSVEQVARDFVIDMIKNPDKARGEVTADAVASGGAEVSPPGAAQIKTGEA